MTDTESLEPMARSRRRQYRPANSQSRISSARCSLALMGGMWCGVPHSSCPLAARSAIFPATSHMRHSCLRAAVVTWGYLYPA